MDKTRKYGDIDMIARDCSADKIIILTSREHCSTKLDGRYELSRQEALSLCDTIHVLLNNGSLINEIPAKQTDGNTSNMTPRSLSLEEYREYDIQGRKEPYRINYPLWLYFRPGGSTHRVVDADGIVHCVPAPGQLGCVLRWKPKDPNSPVQF